MGKIGFILAILIDIGRLSLATYSIYIKQMIDSAPDYKAQCDISDYVSCSKTFNSKYGKGFGLIGDLLGEDHPLNLPNGVYGSVFFSLHLLLVLFARNSKLAMQIRLVNSAVLTVGCGWLAYTLLFVLKHMCVVCIPMYSLNVVALATDAWQLHKRTAITAGPGRESAGRAQRVKKRQ